MQTYHGRRHRARILAEADAAISAWDMKLNYDFWRPVSAIRAADNDSNLLWTPLLTTMPPFPGYVSGHSTFSGSSAAILADLFGDATAFSSTADNGLTRIFSSFSQAADEAGMSRIYGGIHWQFDNVYCLIANDGIGQYVSANYLTAPLPGTLTMTLTGFGAMLLTAWRRRR